MKLKRYFIEDIPRRKFLQMSLKGGIALAATPSLMMQLLSCKGQKQVSARLELDPQMLGRTIKKALEKGGEFAEVYVENRISRRIIHTPTVNTSIKRSPHPIAVTYRL